MVFYFPLMHLKSAVFFLRPAMKFLLSFLFGALQFPSLALAAWGYTDDGSNYVVDTGTSLVFAVDYSNGDVTSLKYDGVVCYPLSTAHCSSSGS